jgi:hypothetical protein
VTRDGLVWLCNRRRNFAHGWVYLVAGGIHAPIVLAAAVVAVATGDRDALLLAVFGAPFTYAGLRAGRGILRSGAAVTASDVVIRGPWSERRFELARVDAFTTGEHLGGAGGVLLKLTDGDEVAVWTLAQDGLTGNGERNALKWEPVAARLNALLLQQRSGA